MPESVKPRGGKARSGMKGAKGPRRTPIQRTLDKAEMVRLLRRGWTRTEVAELLEVHPSMITYDLNQVLREELENQEKDTEVLRRLKLEEYREVKKEAWDAWERSKLEKTFKTLETKSAGDYSYDKETTHIEKPVGEARYLHTVLQCLDSERELLGIDPPKKVDIKGEHTVVDVSMTWDQLAQAYHRGKVDVDVVERSIQGALQAAQAPEEPSPNAPDPQPAPTG